MSHWHEIDDIRIDDDSVLTNERKNKVIKLLGKPITPQTVLLQKDVDFNAEINFIRWSFDDISISSSAEQKYEDLYHAENDDEIKNILPEINLLPSNGISYDENGKEVFAVPTPTYDDSNGRIDMSYKIFNTKDDAELFIKVMSNGDVGPRIYEGRLILDVITNMVPMPENVSIHELTDLMMQKPVTIINEPIVVGPDYW